MLKHRTRRPVVSPRPSYARPARVRSQVCSVWRRCIEGSCWLCYETTARTALQVWLRRSLERVVRASDGPTARTHATAPARPSWNCLRMGGVAQFVPSAGREGVGKDGWPVSAIPKLAIRSDRGLSRWGIPRLSHACSRPHCQHQLNARAPPPTPHPFSPDGAVFGIGFDDPRDTWVHRVVDLHSRRPEGRADRR